MTGERVETAGEYTPTTDEVQAVWREWSEYGGLTNRPTSTDRAGMVGEFDRWLAQVRADAYAQGGRDALTAAADEWEETPGMRYAGAAARARAAQIGADR